MVRAREWKVFDSREVFACARAIVPASTVQAIADAYPLGLAIRDFWSRTPLHYATHVRGNSLNLNGFRTLLHANKRAARMRDNKRGIPLHVSCCEDCDIRYCWELLHCFPDGASVVGKPTFHNFPAMTPLQLCLYFIENQCVGGNRGITPLSMNLIWAKVLLMKLALHYKFVPDVPTDETVITAFVTHPSVQMIADRLQPGDDGFILHAAIAADCPYILFEALINVFPLSMHVRDPSGNLPLEMAMQNLAGGKTLEQSQIVYHLLQSNPAYLKENTAWRPVEKKEESPTV